MRNDDGPAGLSTRITPAGSSALGTTGLPSDARDDALGDLVDREIGAEAGRLAVAAASERPGHGGHVELVDRRSKRHLPRRAAVAGGFADQGGELGALDGAKVVDDPLRV